LPKKTASDLVIVRFLLKHASSQSAESQCKGRIARLGVGEFYRLPSVGCGLGVHKR
jgi:hypothetical protein